MIYYIIFLIVCAFVMFEYFRRYFKDLNTIVEVKEDNKAKDVNTEIKELDSPLPLKNRPTILYSKLSQSEIEYLNKRFNDSLVRNISRKIDIYGENKPTILDIDRSIPATLKEYKDLVKEQSYIDYILKTKGEDYIMNLEFLNHDETVSINVEDIDMPFYAKKRNSYHTGWQIKSMRNYYLNNQK